MPTHTLKHFHAAPWRKEALQKTTRWHCASLRFCADSFSQLFYEHATKKHRDAQRHLVFLCKASLRHKTVFMIISLQICQQMLIIYVHALHIESVSSWQYCPQHPVVRHFSEVTLQSVRGLRIQLKWCKKYNFLLLKRIQSKMCSILTVWSGQMHRG